MSAPRITPAEAAVIEAAMRSTACQPTDAQVIEMTQAQLVQRINTIKPQVLAARAAAFDKMRPLGLTGLAQVLQLHDDGVFTAEQTIRSMRETLGLPVIHDSRELGDLMAALYQGRYLGRASESAAGGHDGL